MLQRSDKAIRFDEERPLVIEGVRDHIKKFLDRFTGVDRLRYIYLINSIVLLSGVNPQDYSIGNDI
jgi:hypothetical protein